MRAFPRFPSAGEIRGSSSSILWRPRPLDAHDFLLGGPLHFGLVAALLAGVIFAAIYSLYCDSVAERKRARPAITLESIRATLDSGEPLNDQAAKSASFSSRRAPLMGAPPRAQPFFYAHFGGGSGPSGAHARPLRSRRASAPILEAQEVGSDGEREDRARQTASPVARGNRALGRRQSRG
jgi:hypothetical protein